MSTTAGAQCEGRPSQAERRQANDQDESEPLRQRRPFSPTACDPARRAFPPPMRDVGAERVRSSAEILPRGDGDGGRSTATRRRLQQQPQRFAARRHDSAGSCNAAFNSASNVAKRCGSPRRYRRVERAWDGRSNRGAQMVSERRIKAAFADKPSSSRTASGPTPVVRRFRRRAKATPARRRNLRETQFRSAPHAAAPPKTGVDKKCLRSATRVSLAAGETRPHHPPIERLCRPRANLSTQESRVSRRRETHFVAPPCERHHARR